MDCVRLSVDVVSLMSDIVLAVVSAVVAVAIGLLAISVLVTNDGSLDDVAMTESVTLDTASVDVVDDDDDVGMMSDEAAMGVSLRKEINKNTLPW